MSGFVNASRMLHFNHYVGLCVRVHACIRMKNIFFVALFHICLLGNSQKI